MAFTANSPIWKMAFKPNQILASLNWLLTPDRPNFRLARRSSGADPGTGRMPLKSTSSSIVA
jgi:hypothetical protein